jgi:chorismate mutase / prephenate dehydratase
VENLENLRNSIDHIDTELIELFERRMEIVNAIALYKKEHDLPVLNSTREEEVLSNNLSRVKNKEFVPYIKELLKFMMLNSRDYQQTILRDK